MNYPMLMDLSGEFIYVPQTSGTNTYTAAFEGLVEYKTGQPVLVRFTNANTGASTLNINGLGAKNITRNGNVALLSGDISANSVHQLVYDGTNFQLQSQGAKLTALQMQTPLTGYAAGSNTAISALNTVLSAFGQLQSQMNARLTTTIKSVQTGIVTSSAGRNLYNDQIVLSPVNTEKSIAIINMDSAGFLNGSSATVHLRTSTSLYLAITANVDLTAVWKVIEFY